MRTIYEDTVGLGANMLLNIAPPINGTIPAIAMATYAALGAWVVDCYGIGDIAAPSKYNVVDLCYLLRVGFTSH